jgi:hypothetical protein
MANPSDNRYVGRHVPGAPRERTAPHLGPFRATPLRTTLGIALLGSLLIVGYGVSVRDANQIPVLTAGMAISGVVFGLLALAGAFAVYRQAADGRSGRALVYAILGGAAALLAAGFMAAAIILALVAG